MCFWNPWIAKSKVISKLVYNPQELLTTVIIAISPVDLTKLGFFIASITRAYDTYNISMVFMGLICDQT